MAELGRELQRQRLNRQDFLADTRSIEMESDSYASTLNLSLDDKTLSFTVGETAHQQIAARLNIPFRYYKKMQEEAPDTAQKYIDWFNKILDANKTRLTRNIFNNDMPIDKIEIRQFSATKKVTVTLNDKTIQKGYGYTPINSTEFELDIYRDNSEALFVSNFLIAWHLLMFDLTRIARSLEYEETPIYLPASRTGLLLAHRLIASKATRSMLSMSSSEDFQEKLTAPYVQFWSY